MSCDDCRKEGRVEELYRPSLLQSIDPTTLPANSAAGKGFDVANRGAIEFSNAPAGDTVLCSYDNKDFFPVRPRKVPAPIRGVMFFKQGTTAPSATPKLDLLHWSEQVMAIIGEGASLGVIASRLAAQPAASALNDADPNPTTTRVGANVLIWDGSTWERWKHAVWGDNAPLVGLTPATNAFGAVYSDRTGNYFKQRQPNATAPKSVVQSAISLASTGVKATRTMAQDGYLRFAVVSPLTGTPTNAVVQLQLVRSAVTYALGNTGALGASLSVSFPIGFTTTNVAPWIGIPVLIGDVVQVNVITASAAATADFAIGFEEALYTV